MKRLELQLPELNFAAEEALKRLRINIKFVSAEIKTIMVTSSVPNEGKSFISLYLWKMLAESGVKVLYMDLDLRNSVMLKKYAVDTGKRRCGLEHYLSGIKGKQDIIYETNYENAHIIPCANILENPANLFDDPNFPLLLKELREEYRYILIDTPPVIHVTDSAQIASVCDGCIFVVHSGSTSKKLVQQAARQLHDAGCTILGSVLNCVETGSKRYGYGSGYGYGYGYGSDKKEKKKFGKTGSP